MNLFMEITNEFIEKTDYITLNKIFLYYILYSFLKMKLRT